MGRRALTPPQLSDVKALFHIQIRDAAAALGISVPSLRSFCRKNGIPHWPGKKFRSLKDKIRKLAMEAKARQAALPGEAGHRPRVKIVEDISKVLEDMVRILQIQISPPVLQENGSNGTAEVSKGNSGLPAGSSADASRPSCICGHHL
ncbi:hypothetical protein EJB05_08961 [Eragrostis curvula]|uniref:RWP-RK domain-containing protein n=1 Tax=Eragrostis curvula TaxID=38414 RepID=A0A5J9W2D0_9POAL|nr:hypothetical protein EJB05_08961 [Eragrostis curvula]